MPFYDALYGHTMRHILVRHEAAAAFAAGGYARTSGRVGVCCRDVGSGCDEPRHRPRRRDDGLDSGRRDHGASADGA